MIRVAHTSHVRLEVHNLSCDAQVKLDCVPKSKTLRVRDPMPCPSIRVTLVLAVSLFGCGNDDAPNHGQSGNAATANTAGVTGAAARAGSSNAGAAGEARTGSGGAAGTPHAGNAAAGTMATLTEPPPDDGSPTWSGIYEHVFRTCRVDICHGGGLMGINLANKQAGYDTLYDQPASAVGKCIMLGKKRIVPGQPDESLLYLKLDGHTPCGQQMPPGGQLSQEARDRVRAWIMRGAMND